MRFLARERLLGETGVSKTDERRIARSTLRQLTKGHYSVSATKAGLEGKAPRDDAYGRLLRTLHAEPRTLKSRRNETEASIEKRQRAERSRVNGPDSPKALLLVALGFRDPSADYDVGETP